MITKLTVKTLKINLLLNLVFYPLFYTWPVRVSSKQHENFKLFLHTDWRDEPKQCARK